MRRHTEINIHQRSGLLVVAKRSRIVDGRSAMQWRVLQKFLRSRWSEGVNSDMKLQSSKCYIRGKTPPPDIPWNTYMHHLIFVTADLTSIASPQTFIHPGRATSTLYNLHSEHSFRSCVDMSEVSKSSEPRRIVGAAAASTASLSVSDRLVRAITSSLAGLAP